MESESQNSSKTEVANQQAPTPQLIALLEAATESMHRIGITQQEPEAESAESQEKPSVISNELKSLRDQWDTLSECTKSSAVGIRLSVWISDMEASIQNNMEGSDEASAPAGADEVTFDTNAKIAADEGKKVMEKENKCAELHVEIHELEVTIADLKLKIAAMGQYKRLAELKAKHDYELRIETLLNMLFKSVDPPVESPQQRIIALNRRIIELEEIAQEQRNEIGALADALRKE